MNHYYFSFILLLLLHKSPLLYGNGPINAPQPFENIFHAMFSNGATLTEGHMAGSSSYKVTAFKSFAPVNFSIVVLPSGSMIAYVSYSFVSTQVPFVSFMNTLNFPPFTNTPNQSIASTYPLFSNNACYVLQTGSNYSSWPSNISTANIIEFIQANKQQPQGSSINLNQNNTYNLPEGNYTVYTGQGFFVLSQYITGPTSPQQGLLPYLLLLENSVTQYNAFEYQTLTLGKKQFNSIYQLGF